MLSSCIPSNKIPGNTAGTFSFLLSFFPESMNILAILLNFWKWLTIVDPTCWSSFISYLILCHVSQNRLFNTSNKEVNWEFLSFHIYGMYTIVGTPFITVVITAPHFSKIMHFSPLSSLLFIFKLYKILFI